MNKDIHFYTCYQCNSPHATIDNLYNHHCSSPVPELVLESVLNTRNAQHYSTGYDVHYAAELSPIPQLDGPSTPLHSLVHPSAPPQHKPSIRRSSYTLDKKKQLARLCKDTKLDDYEITVSPIAHNVTIKCSAGFYLKVVLPSFSSFTEQYHNQVDGIIIRCIKVEGHIDGDGSNVTAMIIFELIYEHQAHPSIGTVTIHLHHTARKIQLQGSSLVHDRTRAPVWFVDSFLKGIFSHFAKMKSVDISNFNSAVHDMLTSHIQKISSQGKCGGCGSLFGGRSVSEICSSCHKQFHKSCFQDKRHSCSRSFDTLTKSLPVTSLLPNASPNAIAGSARSPISTPASISSDIQMAPTYSSATAPSMLPSSQPLPTFSTENRPPSVTSSPIITAATFQIATTASAAPIHFPVQATHSQTQDNNPAPILNPFANLFVPSPLANVPQSRPAPPPPILPTHTAPPPPNIIPGTTTRSRAPVRKNKPPLPPQNLDLEYAKIELNTAQATINVLETTVNDLRFRNGILEDRVKQLEEMKKTEIFDRYFPTQQRRAQSHGQSIQSPCHSQCCRNPPQQCCHQPPHCCHDQAQHSQPGFGSLENIESVISSLRAEVEVIKSKLDQFALSNNQLVNPFSAAPHHSSDVRPAHDSPPHPAQHAAQLSPGAGTALHRSHLRPDQDNALNPPQHAVQLSPRAGAAKHGSVICPDQDSVHHPLHHAAQHSHEAGASLSSSDVHSDHDSTPHHPHHPHHEAQHYPGSHDQLTEPEHIQNSSFLSCEQEMADFDSEDPLNCE